jgi:hypothetical protein
MLLITFADKTYTDFADNICTCLKAKPICKHDFVRTHHAWFYMMDGLSATKLLIRNNFFQKKN